MENNKKAVKAKAPKSKNRKPMGVLIFSLVVLAITGFVVFRFEMLASSAWNATGGSGQMGTIHSDHAVGYEDQTTFHVEEGYILQSGEGVLTFYGPSAEPIWEKALNGQGVYIAGNDKSMAVVNPGTGDVFLMDTQGQVTAKAFGLGPMDQVLHPSADHLVCHMPEANALKIFDANLEEVARIPMPDGEMLELDVSSTQSLIAVSMFRLEADTYHSQILTYHLDGQAIGAINLKDKIILDIAVLDDLMIGVTDQQAFAYNTSNTLVWEVPVDRTIKKAGVSVDGTVLLNLVRSGDDLTDTRPENALKYINAMGETIEEIPIQYDVEEIKRRGDKTVFSTSDRLYILSDGGTMQSILDTSGNLRAFEFVSDSHLAVEFGDRLDILKLEP